MFFKAMTNEKCFSDSTTATNDHKFRFFGAKRFPECFLFFFAAYDGL